MPSKVKEHRRPVGRTASAGAAAGMRGAAEIVLDGTIVNVALPAIQGSLGFSEISLSWVVNAYLLTFGGFLLLGGRAGDVFGRRRVFMLGLALFTLASLFCGLSGSRALPVAGSEPVAALNGGYQAAFFLSAILVALAAVLAAALLRLTKDGKEVGGKTPTPPSEATDAAANDRKTPTE